MPQDNLPLSQVVPVLVAALICDVAVPDPTSGKKNLIGVFDKVNVGRFPTSRPVSVYFKLTDAEGRYEFNIRYVQVATGKTLAQAKGELRVKDRLASSDLCIQFPPLPIPAEGRYEFQVWANSTFLGSTFLDAVRRPQPAGEEERGGP